MGKYPGHIFLCDKKTGQRCLDINLFGGTESYRKQVSAVDVGDKLFLYDYSTYRLIGIFEATSEAAINIIPNAWKDLSPLDFNWQVRVQRLTDSRPLSKIEVDGIIDFPTRFSRGSETLPQGNLTAEQVQKLENAFNSEERLPIEEIDYRLKNLASLITEDGHKVRSEYERVIDDWLYAHHIVHGYEKRFLEDRPYLCDFFVPVLGRDQTIYIEYWGLKDKDYLQRRANKEKLYADNGLELIGIDSSDIEEIKQILVQKLSHYLPGMKLI